MTLPLRWLFFGASSNDDGYRRDRRRPRPVVIAEQNTAIGHDGWNDDPDHAALASMRAGDVVAFESLFHRYYTRLVRAAYGYVRARDVAEEVVQDLMFRLWTRRGDMQVTGSVAVYLFTAVRHESMKRVRRAAIEQRWTSREAAALASDERDVEIAPDATAERRELHDAIGRAMASLPERCREVFRLYREQDLRAPEIAQILGITPSTVRVQLARAVRALRTQLAEYRRR